MAEIRKFESGADRDVDHHKPDPEGYLSPLAIRAYNQYMLKHQTRKDGTKRESDNWQNGVPVDSLMSSAWRHFLDVWTLHRGYPCQDYDGNKVELEEALSALLFNVQAMLHEVVKDKYSRPIFPELKFPQATCTPVQGGFISAPPGDYVLRNNVGQVPLEGCRHVIPHFPGEICPR